MVATEDGRPSIRNDDPARLDWDAFSSRYFSGRLRHDLESLKAYEAYRFAATAPQPPSDEVITES